MFRKKAGVKFVVRVVIEPDEDGFHAYCPALKGLHTCGDTEEEASNNARDAVFAYLHSLVKHGDPIPVGILVNGSKDEPSPHPRIRDLVVAGA